LGFKGFWLRVIKDRKKKNRVTRNSPGSTFYLEGVLMKIENLVQWDFLTCHFYTACQIVLRVRFMIFLHVHSKVLGGNIN